MTTWLTILVVLGSFWDMKDRTIDGGKLRSLRLAALLKQRELAERVGVHSTTICHIETDAWEASDLLAHKLAAALGCSVEDFTDPKPSTVVDDEQVAA